VAHPVHVKHITAAKVKTDARDALTLAKLLAAKLICDGWTPPVTVRELRAACPSPTPDPQRTQARNRRRRVLHRHNIVPPTGEVFSAKQRTWWTPCPRSPVEQLRAAYPSGRGRDAAAGLAPTLPLRRQPPCRPA